MQMMKMKPISSRELLATMGNIYVSNTKLDYFLGKFLIVEVVDMAHVCSIV